MADDPVHVWRKHYLRERHHHLRRALWLVIVASLALFGLWFY
jgi:hypothetical protein